MTMTETTRRPIGVGGIAFLVVALLMAGMATYILFVPIDASDFETTTALSWADFSSATPKAADYLTREARLLAMGFLGLSSLTAAMAWGGFRRDDRRVSRALWSFPLTLLGAAIVFLAGEGPALGSTYLTAGILAAVGLVAADRSRGER